MRQSGNGRRLVTAMRGVTLIELMIVIVVVGILAAIAYPSYQEQVRKTRRTDGQAALLDVAQKLERCFTRFNRYNSADCAVHADLTDGDGITTPEGWYTITNTNVGARTFTLSAAPQGAQTADSCGTLTLTHTGVRSPANCW